MAELTADDIRSLLALEPNATCGFVRETYRSALSIAPGGLPTPFASGRPLGSALYFMATPAAPVKLHRIRNDQLYHYYLGDPLEVLMLRGDGKADHVIVGPDLRAGHRLQLFIPGHTFHTARLAGAAAGFSAPAPNGRAYRRSTSRWATPKAWRRNIRRSRPTSITFRSRPRRRGSCVGSRGALSSNRGRTCAGCAKCRPEQCDLALHRTRRQSCGSAPSAGPINLTVQMKNARLQAQRHFDEFA